MNRSQAFVTKIRNALAPCSLAPWPTPLVPAPQLARALGLAALWIKREDEAGGNKVRGLEFLLAGARPGSVFVTVGGDGSSHCLATARHARGQGHRSAIAVFRQPESEVSRRVAATTRGAADVVIGSGSVITLPWAVVRAWTAARRLGTPIWIPGGGATPRAVIGHVLAALELDDALDAPPDKIIVPLGTGGTAAGIALGIAWLGWSTEVVAVRVTPRIVANRWRTTRLARRAAATLRQHGIDIAPPRFSHLRITNAVGRGYGHPTPTGERARALAAEYGLQLDPTYGAKAFGVLLGPELRNQRVIFWHTFPSS